MIYGSVCSGIEAATMAWHGLGWSPAFFSEIEKFPSAVLAHHYPDVPNLGDMSKFEDWSDYAIDLLVGGTPCQSFSVAGLRKGLDDPRGNLMLTYLAIARRYKPRWLVWENVPGVLSSNGGRDFGTLIRGLEELGYHAAWRVLDAQYVRTPKFPWAVPQRRRRVFVVGYLGDWRPAAAVLFDSESLRRDSAPRREAGKAATGALAARTQAGGGFGTDFELDGGQNAVCADVGSCLDAHFGSRLGLENQHIDRGAPLFVANTLLAKPNDSHSADLDTYVAHGLRAEGFDASDDGTGPGAPIAPIQFDCKGTEVQVDESGCSQPLRSMGHLKSHQNAGGHAAVAFDTTQMTSPENRSNPKPGDACHPLASRAHAPAIATQWAVRRLTPRECERLQGFPDDFTAIPWRGKTSENCPDGPRYKALGNSMAVNVMSLIGERIAEAEGYGRAAA